MKVQNKGAMAFALCLSITTSLAAMPVSGQTALATAQDQEPDPAKVEKLIQAIDATVAAMPATATAQDLEASITFTLDQQQNAMNANLAALEFVAARRNKPRKLQVAVNAVIAALRRGLAGTGGLLSDNGASLAAGPNVSGGGTGANYTPQN
jgi:hypothetical protein